MPLIDVREIFFSRPSSISSLRRFTPAASPDSLSLSRCSLRFSLSVLESLTSFDDLLSDSCLTSFSGNECDDAEGGGEGDEGKVVFPLGISRDPPSRSVDPFSGAVTADRSLEADDMSAAIVVCVELIVADVCDTDESTDTGADVDVGAGVDASADDVEGVEDDNVEVGTLTSFAVRAFSGCVGGAVEGFCFVLASVSALVVGVAIAVVPVDNGTEDGNGVGDVALFFESIGFSIVRFASLSGGVSLLLSLAGVRSLAVHRCSVWVGECI